MEISYPYLHPALVSTVSFWLELLLLCIHIRICLSGSSMLVPSIKAHPRSKSTVLPSKFLSVPTRFRSIPTSSGHGGIVPACCTPIPDAPALIFDPWLLIPAVSIVLWSIILKNPSSTFCRRAIILSCISFILLFISSLVTWMYWLKFEDIFRLPP